ncbi:MAG: hypothetical protein EPO65_03645, partial [Dehalococcoidia bacterium]
MRVQLLGGRPAAERVRRVDVGQRAEDEPFGIPVRVADHLALPADGVAQRLRMFGRGHVDRNHRRVVHGVPPRPRGPDPPSRRRAAVLRDARPIAMVGRGQGGRRSGPEPSLLGVREMARRKVLLFPDKRLRVKARPVEKVDAAIRRLIDDLAETMYSEPGVGLAAPQVGVPYRVFVIDTASPEGGELRAFINPHIIANEGEIAWKEGCLSFRSE